MNGQLALLDYVILIAYLGGILALGLSLGRKIHTGTDFFLAGRSLPWWAISMSLVATDIGGTDIIGVGGAAYSHGLVVGNFEWIGCVPAMIVASFIFIPLFYRLGIYTIPEFMERRYNAFVRSALATCWLVFMACNLGIMLFASAKMMSVLFGWDQAVCIWATAILVGIYTYAGGLAAVVYTDMIQCVVMIGGCLLVLVIGLIDIGGVGELKNRLREIEAKQAVATAQESGAELPDQEFLDVGRIEHTSLILPVDTKSPFPWTGILFGLALILSPAYWIGNQAIVQRSFGAKSEFEAKQAYIWGAVLKNIIPIIIAVPGLIALVKYPELADGDQAFPMLVSQLLPTGFRGLFLAAFLAALMSSVDSYLNSASTILSHDLYKRFLNPAATDERLLVIGRATTVALVCWAILFAFLVMNMKEGIYTMFQTLMAFFQGPALAILLPGIFWKRANGSGAGAGFVCGVLFSISLYALNQPIIYEALGLQPLFQVADPFLYFSVWAFLVALGVLVVVSLFTKPEPKEKLAAIFDRNRNTQEPAA